MIPKKLDITSGCARAALPGAVNSREEGNTARGTACIGPKQPGHDGIAKGLEIVSSPFFVTEKNSEE